MYMKIKYLKNFVNLKGGMIPNDPNHLVIYDGTIEITRDMVPRTTTSVTIPNSVTSIGDNAFAETPLTNVTIPNSVTRIGNLAFAKTQLTDVTIPNRVTSIGNGAFFETPLTNVNIPNSVTSIGDGAFSDTQLTNVTIPNSVTTIGMSAFTNTLLTNVTIPNSVTTIGDSAFAQTPLNNVTIGNNVTSIGLGAFFDTQLTNVTIPNRDANIDDYAFDNNVIITRGDPADDPNHLVIPDGTIEITEDMVPRTTTSVTIPNSVTSIGDGAFANTQLTNVTIPNSVTSIGDGAFVSTQLTNVTIPNSVTSIGMSAFVNTQLTNVTIPNSVTSIGNYAFEGTQLTDVTIPNSVTTIGEAAFSYTQLTDVTIPNSVTTIGDSAFAFTPLNNVTIGNNVTTIEDRAFFDTQLTNVTIPNSVTTIGDGAFENTQLTNVTIPNGDANIDNNAFDSNVIITIGDPTDDPNLAIPEGTIEIRQDPVLEAFYENEIVEYSNRNNIYIDRENIFESFKNFTKNRPDFYNYGIKVIFTNQDGVQEAGIDEGGLTREFFTLISLELLQNKYFLTQDNGYSTIFNDQDNLKPIKDYHLIGKLFAYAVKTKNTINIKLNPLLLYLIKNSITIDSNNISEEQINKTQFNIINDLIDTLPENLTLKKYNNQLLSLIIKELNSEMIINEIDTLEKVMKIFNDYDSDIFTVAPFSKYFILNEDNWTSSNLTSICLDEYNSTCLMFDNPIPISFSKKDIFLLYIIKHLSFMNYISEAFAFVNGFITVINQENLQFLTLKQLNTLIIGHQNILFSDFNQQISFINVNQDKQQMIRNIIEENSRENTEYLAELLYLFTGSRTLPALEWGSFNVNDFEIRFISDRYFVGIKSHTCSGYKYLEIHENYLNDDDKLREIFTFEKIKEWANQPYCLVGGGKYIKLFI